VPFARLVHEDAAHRAGGQAEEVGPVLDPGAPLVDQAQVGLVDEGRRGDQAARPLPPELAVRQAVERLVDERHQLVERLPAPLAPGDEQSGDVLGGLRHDGCAIVPTRAKKTAPRLRDDW
jgi:hypothetical protein